MNSPTISDVERQARELARELLAMLRQVVPPEKRQANWIMNASDPVCQRANALIKLAEASLAD